MEQEVVGEASLERGGEMEIWSRGGGRKGVFWRCLNSGSRLYVENGTGGSDGSYRRNQRISQDKPLWLLSLGRL